MPEGEPDYRRHRREIASRFADNPSGEPPETPEELQAFLRQVGSPEEIEARAQDLLRVSGTFHEAAARGGFSAGEEAQISDALTRLGHRLDELRDLAEWAVDELEDRGMRYADDRERVETASGRQLLSVAVERVFPEAQEAHGGWDYSQDFLERLRSRLEGDFSPDELTDGRLKSALQYLQRRDRL